MNREQVHAKLRDHAAGARHRVGNVVKLQIKEDRQTSVLSLFHDPVAAGAKQLQSDLHHPDATLDPVDERERRGRLRKIQGEANPIDGLGTSERRHHTSLITANDRLSVTARGLSRPGATGKAIRFGGEL